MVTIRLVVLTLAFSLAALSITVDAQQPRPVHLIGILLTSASPDDPLGHALSEGLGELGYVEGRDFRVEYRSAEGQLDRLPRLAEELVYLKVEAMIVATEAALLAAKQATTTIPIVVQLFDYDPVAEGLIDSLSHPGGNITGVFTRAPVRRVTPIGHQEARSRKLRLAYFVDRILKGTNPRDLPVEQPSTFELAINLTTAKALSLTVPELILLRADEVIR